MFCKVQLELCPRCWTAGWEILETLWSEFNKVSASVHSMSKAHRAEVYDDHMRDSNWKKLVGMGE